MTQKKALPASIISLLLIANTINIGADVAAMGQAMTLLSGGSAQWYAIGFGLLSVLLRAARSRRLAP